MLEELTDVHPVVLFGGVAAAASVGVFFVQRRRKRASAAQKARQQGMSPEEFRAAGHALVDWLVDHRLKASEFPVVSHVEPGYLRKILASEAPHDGESWGAILADFSQGIVPGLTHLGSPNCFSQDQATAFPCVLADLFSSGLGAFGFSVMSPAHVELESVIADWVAKMLGLQEVFCSDTGGGAVIQHSSFDAFITAILAARARILSEIPPNEHEGVGNLLVAYVSDQSWELVRGIHERTGLPLCQFRCVKTVGSNHRLTASAVQAAIATDLSSGLVPMFLCCSLGSACCGTLDPIQELAGIAVEQGLWLHVDGSYAAGYGACPELREPLAVHNYADTYVVGTNPLLAELDGGEGVLMFYQHAGFVGPASHRLPQPGSWVRAYRLWFGLRAIGVAGLQNRLRHNVRLATVLEELVSSSAEFELVTPRCMGMVSFRLRGRDDLETAQLLEAVNATGLLVLSGAEVAGRVALLCFCGAPFQVAWDGGCQPCGGGGSLGRYSEECHVRAAWEVLLAETRTLFQNK